jgi:hypothetical protein
MFMMYISDTPRIYSHLIWKCSIFILTWNIVWLTVGYLFLFWTIISWWYFIMNLEFFKQVVETLRQLQFTPLDN